MQEIKETTSYRQALKTKILETAIKAFAERGVRAVRMDDVATTLAISKRTLYEIYEDKEALLYQGIITYDREKREKMRLYAETHNVMDVILHAYSQKVEETQRVCLQFYIDIQKYPRIVQYMEKEHETTRQYFCEFLKRGVEEGYFRKDVNYDLLPYLFDALGKYMSENQIFKEYDFKELFRTLLLVPLRGFSTPKGLQVLEKYKF